MVANILSADSSLTLRMASLGQNSTILEYSHVEYQIKGYHQIQQQGEIFCRQTPLCPAVWVKGQNSTFSEHGNVAYQIKGTH